MDSVFDHIYGGGAFDTQSVNWLPPLETYEKDGQYFVRLDLPGVDPKDVEVSAEDGILTVKGERKNEDEGERGAHRYRETFYGTFQRQLTLPKGIENDKITARYENGVLDISIPVPLHPSAKNVPIEIKAKKSDEAKAA